MKFILFYSGPETPADASHKGWPSWFSNLGKALVDPGAPLSKGVVLHNDDSTEASKTSYNGYSIIEAKDLDKALELIKDHPYLTLGNEYTIEIFKKG